MRRPLAFADAGLLDGLPATTHWGAIEMLGTLGSDIEVRPDDRFVDAGSVVTASGVSAGIDMALYLVARLHSTERAREVRRLMQYDPKPSGVIAAVPPIGPNASLRVADEPGSTA